MLECVQPTFLNAFLSRKEYESDYSCRSGSTPRSKFDVMSESEVMTGLFWLSTWPCKEKPRVICKMERFQSKVLRIITDAPRYMPNTVIRRHLKVSSVRQEVRNYSVTYRYRLDDHLNRLAKSLFQGPAPNRRLKRCQPADLATRF